ncbi:MAG TPA: CPBP family intramembrane glutamic endopeptidase [Gemmatimonadaceae bacterium]|nr:CPBP family intramembrane glutamic endopeptidase [Gemmatimonadaceae bacterium]
MLGPASNDPRGVTFQWLALTSVVIATAVMLRIDKQTWSFVGLDPGAAAPRRLINGALLGAATIGTASVLLLATRMLRIEPALPGSWWGAAGRSVLVLLPAAFFEELFIRGFAFAVLRRAGGWRLALVATSIVFGLLHAWNPGADAESILAVIVAGFFLGAILLATGSLYAAGAAHFAWNWVMAGGLHIAVSGIPSSDPDYRTVETGPDWLTGGRWGPEGGLAAVAAMFIAIFYLYGRYLRGMELRK